MEHSALITLPKGAVVGPTHLRLPPGTTKEVWADVANQAVRVGHGYTWWLADLAAYAMHYLDAKAMTELADATGLALPTLVLYGELGRAFPVLERKPAAIHLAPPTCRAHASQAPSCNAQASTATALVA